MVYCKIRMILLADMGFGLGIFVLDPIFGHLFYSVDGTIIVNFIRNEMLGFRQYIRLCRHS